VSTPTFLTALAVGAGLIALWLHFRYPGLAPERIRTILFHIGASILIAAIVVPALSEIAEAQLSTRTAALTTIFLIGLPALTYQLLAAVWVMSMAQSAMARYKK